MNSGYSKKDVLKSRGYQWDPDGKPPCWHTEVDEKILQNELEFLKKEIYQRDFQIPIHKIYAYNRYGSPGSRALYMFSHYWPSRRRQ